MTEAASGGTSPAILPPGHPSHANLKCENPEASRALPTATVALALLLLATGLHAKGPEIPAKVLSNHFRHKAVGFQDGLVADEVISQLETAALSNPVMAKKLLAGGVVTPMESLHSRATTSPIVPWNWRSAKSHPFLSRVLPGVRFYSVEYGVYHSMYGDSRVEMLVAERKGRCYEMPDQFISLLRDAGRGFRRKDLGWELQACLTLWAAKKRGDQLEHRAWSDADRRELVDYWDLPLFPEVSVDSIWPGEVPDTLTFPFIELRGYIGRTIFGASVLWHSNGERASDSLILDAIIGWGNFDGRTSLSLSGTPLDDDTKWEPDDARDAHHTCPPDCHPALTSEVGRR